MIALILSIFLAASEASASDPYYVCRCAENRTESVEPHELEVYLAQYCGGRRNLCEAIDPSAPLLQPKAGSRAFGGGSGGAPAPGSASP